MNTGPRRRHAEEPQHAPGAAAGRDRRRLERLELQAAGHGDARRIGADVDDAPRRLVALHAEAIDVGEHAPEEPRAPAGSADTTATRSGRSPASSSRRCCRQARSRFGQISVSIMMKSRGRTSRSVRLTNGGRSNGKKKTASTSCSRVRAICWPVSVVVERKMRRPGIALAQIGDRARAPSAPRPPTRRESRSTRRRRG